MAGARKALVVATYDYRDTGLSRLAAPEHDAESFAAVLADPDVAGFEVTTLVNEPHHVVGEAIADFYAGCRRDDLALLYFSGHGLKDDEGRLHLAMSNTRREALLFTAISAAQLNDAMEASASRRKVLVLDCCYSGAFPAGRAAKSDEGVQTLERFQGKGRAVLTASDATQYAFEGDSLTGAGSSSVFTRYLVEAIRSGAADLDEDGDIALDELYSYVRDRVVAEMPQQRPKKQEDVDGRILIARNVHWTLPAHLRHAVESPIAAQRLSAVDGLGHLHRVGNALVRTVVAERIGVLADDDSRSVSAAATALLDRLGHVPALEVPAPRAAEATTAVEQPVRRVPVPSSGPASSDPSPVAPVVGRPPDEPPPAPAASPAPPARSRWSAAAVVLALVLSSALPLTLSRVLAFESSVPYTADAFNESTTHWSVGVVAPLVVAVGLLSARSRFPFLLPVALGLVAGVGLALAEHAGYWTFWFVDNADGYDVGPGMVLLVAGAALVAVAGGLAATRGELAGRPTVRADWRVACALLVVIAAVLSLAYGPDSSTVPGWLAAAVGTLLLTAVALPLTLLRVRADQRLAALVAVPLFGVWLVYFPLSELLAESSRLGLEPSVWVARVVGVVLTLVACVAAQAGPTSGPAATSEDPP